MNGIDLNICRRNLEILPWYANGTLSPRERADVESHLAVCAACRHEADSLASIAAAIPQPGDPPGGAAAFGQLLHRIGQHERRSRAWRAAAALLLLVIGVAAIALPTYLLEPRYRTVTDALPSAGERVQLELVLDAEADPAALAALMARYDADLVSANTSNGKHFVLEFRLNADRDRESLLQQLRGEKDVRTAQVRDVQ